MSENTQQHDGNPADWRSDSNGGVAAIATRKLAAFDLMVRERISVLPADGKRTDWCGHMIRQRHKRKGCDSWCVYAATPEEAIEAVYAEFMAANGQS